MSVEAIRLGVRRCTSENARAPGSTTR